MSISVNWDNDNKTILRFTVNGDYTSDEMVKATQEVERIAEQVEHKVGVIKDLSNGQIRVENLITVGGGSIMRGDFGSSVRLNSSNNRIAITVIVIASNHLDSVGNTFQKMISGILNQNNTLLTSSLDDARTRIMEYLSQNKDRE
jgi:hypothetical protein